MNRPKESHGYAHTRLYKLWNSMIQRCHNPNNDRFGRYGGRGIVVCDAWRHSFKAFLADMGDPPTDKHSIDRIDNNGNYEPNNCRWATPFEQSINRNPTKRSVSGCKGVRFEERTKSWFVLIGVNYKQHFVGRFKDLNEAIQARHAAEQKFWGRTTNY